MHGTAFVLSGLRYFGAIISENYPLLSASLLPFGSNLKRCKIPRNSADGLGQTDEWEKSNEIEGTPRLF